MYCILGTFITAQSHFHTKAAKFKQKLAYVYHIS